MHGVWSSTLKSVSIRTMPSKRYDWDKWLKRRRFKLHQGTDYDCSHSAIVQQVRSAACDRGVSVSVRENGDSIEVLVVRKRRS